MAWTRLIAAAALLGATLTALPVSAEATVGEIKIGSVMAVITQAEVSGAVGERELAVGTPVYSGDLVETDLGGEVQLMFSDGTRMVLGPGSSLILEEYVFRGDKATNKFAVRALGGAFRFITGVGNSENYSILTPNAKIGVRGTVIEFSVDRNTGDTDVRLREGEATICDEEGEDCAEAVTPCGFVQVKKEDDPKVVEDKQKLKELTESEKFRYFDEDESKFEEDFRVVGAVTCLAAAGGVGLGTAALVGGAAAAAAAALIGSGGPVSPAQ
jgi:hypothetical protein